MFEELKEIICNYVEVEPSDIHPDSRFMEDLGFTSDRKSTRLNSSHSN